MAWKIEVSAEAEHDLELIYDHLVQSYLHFGEPTDEALTRAADRISAVELSLRNLATAPNRGTLRDDIRPGLRNVTVNRAIFWFELDESARLVRVMAVFFGGQDHVRHMLSRLLDD